MTTSDRNSWCTPEYLADMLGYVNLDPFSNYRSKIKATHHCIRERGDDGLRLANGGGFSSAAGRHGGQKKMRAGRYWKVFLNPPYAAGFVEAAIANYEHTRYVALLRLDPSTKWFKRLMKTCKAIVLPPTRIAFEPPPGVKASSNPFPHALFYAYDEDISPEIRAWGTTLTV